MLKLLLCRVAFIVTVFGLSLYAAAQSAVSVVVVSPQSQSASQTLRLSGTVNAVQVSNLSARVAGAVENILVDDGSVVKAGDILIKLDETLERAEFDRLNAELTRAQTEADEAQRLVSEAKRLRAANHIAATELALREARLASAKANTQAVQALVTAQRQRLNYLNIKAPFSGVVTRRIVELGEWVTQGAAVLELVASENTLVDVEIPQADFYRLRSDTRVEIKPDTHSDVILPATIAAKVPVANVATRTFRVRLKADEVNAALAPGTSATATFYIASENDSVLTVPRDALLRNPDDSFALFIVDQKTPLKAMRISVEVGRMSGSTVEILNGLSPDSQVVVRGNEILRHEQPVTIMTKS